MGASHVVHAPDSCWLVPKAAHSLTAPILPSLRSHVHQAASMLYGSHADGSEAAPIAPSHNGMQHIRAQLQAQPVLTALETNQLLDNIAELSIGVPTPLSDPPVLSPSVSAMCLCDLDLELFPTLHDSSMDTSSADFELPASYINGSRSSSLGSLCSKDWDLFLACSTAWVGNADFQ